MGSEELERLLREATPGPWRVSHIKSQSLSVEQDKPWHPIEDPRADNPRNVCRVSLLIESQARPEQVANARLISLTPTIAIELLEARKRIEKLESALRQALEEEKGNAPCDGAPMPWQKNATKVLSP